MFRQPDPTRTQATPAIERRISTRYPCNLATSCRVMAFVVGERIAVRVRNISATGISLIVSQPVDPGTRFTVELQSTTRNVSCELEVRVVYCIDHPNGESILGGRFAQQLPEDEMRIFVA